jgi:ribosomal protein S12 methylthiotransferase
MEVGDGAPKRLFSPRLPALRFTGGPFAYLKVAEGCDHGCAFCAIPGIRGKFRSRGLDELVVEAQALLDSGAKEINLISQDTTSYGMDRRDGARLADLLKALDGLKGDFWLRMLYGYPGRVTDEWLDMMACSRRVCAYLDLPIQHSHPDILRAMHRADTVQAVATMPDRLRKALPGVALRTTCLVGFPGEKEDHFRHLLEYVEAAKFDHLGVFVYSPEEGTAAFEQEDETPPLEVAEERRDRLMQLQQRLVAERQRELTGQTATALLLHLEESEEQGVGDMTWMARLTRQAPDVDGVTHVNGVPEDAKAGDFMCVRITGGIEYDLTSEVIDG